MAQEQAPLLARPWVSGPGLAPVSEPELLSEPELEWELGREPALVPGPEPLLAPVQVQVQAPQPVQEPRWEQEPVRVPFPVQGRVQVPSPVLPRVPGPGLAPVPVSEPGPVQPPGPLLSLFRLSLSSWWWLSPNRHRLPKPTRRSGPPVRPFP